VCFTPEERPLLYARSENLTVLDWIDKESLCGHSEREDVQRGLGFASGKANLSFRNVSVAITAKRETQYVGRFLGTIGGSGEEECAERLQLELWLS